MKFNGINCVFLDRDGCINRAPSGGYVKTPDEMELLPGAAEAIRNLNAAGIKVIVVTNQRGIALGLYSEEDLARIHARMQSLLAAGGAHVDAIYYCPHDRDCQSCRKPNPGMLLRAFADFGDISAASSVMIGNSATDIEAGRRVGMHTILLAQPPTIISSDADAIAANLAEARALLTPWPARTSPAESQEFGRG